MLRFVIPHRRKDTNSKHLHCALVTHTVYRRVLFLSACAYIPTAKEVGLMQCMCCVHHTYTSLCTYLYLPPEAILNILLSQPKRNKIIGPDSPNSSDSDHWNEIVTTPGQQVSHWHTLTSPKELTQRRRKRSKTL